MYQLNSIKPIIYIWSGEFINNTSNTYRHPNKIHDHDFELMLVTSGQFSLCINNKEVVIHEGECLLIPPFSRITGGISSNPAFTMDWLHFLADYQLITQDNATYLRGLQEINAKNESGSINELIYLPTKFKLQKTSYLYQLFRQLIVTAHIKSYSGRKNDFLTSLLLLELSNDFLTQQALKKQQKQTNVGFIAEWIRVHLADNPTVVEVANHFDLNPTYLSRKFHTEYGMGVKSYILEQKIIYARYLLSTTILPIEEVATESFFVSAKHFMRTFKTHTGVTPSTYRSLYSNVHMNSKRVDPTSPIPHETWNASIKKSTK